MIEPRHVDPKRAGEDVRRLDLNSLPKPPAWTAQAACVGMDPDLFYLDKSDPFAAHARVVIKEVCGACPVRQQCLDYAIDNGEQYGIWSGRSFASSARPKRGAA